jgi:hypothetical protein
MPPLADAPPLSRFEFWPASVFYAPVWLWIGLLALRWRGVRLPLVANPGFPAGGLVGESKAAILDRIGGAARAYVADYAAVEASTVAAARAGMAAAELSYPVVAKPDIGCRGAGVRPVRGDAELADYLEGFPPGQRLILQRLIDVEGEAGVFYVRLPGERRGTIFSLTLKYFPHVIGDGCRTLAQLIGDDARAGQLPHLYLHRHRDRLDQVISKGEPVRLAFAGSHSRGAIFRDGHAFITEAMRARFDAIADAIAGFHFGRFDVRFADFAAFQRGEAFHILECNGAGAEATHIWDSRTRLRDAYATLFRQFALLFRIGAANRARGHRPEGWGDFLRRWRAERRLVTAYPPTA